MTDPVTPKRAIWIRAFYDFNPEEAGYVGWTRESGQARALRELKDGDLILVYGASTHQTQRTLRSHVLGFVEIEAQAIRDTDKSSDASQVAKKANGQEVLWPYAIPIRRAWRALDKLPIERVASDTYDKRAG